ncbi:type I restriction enzyme HsdR N-terminal domain-containing protein [Leptolyngbya sp. FACHB-261]|uniref:type I restriction enzyme HsdR N-terminal domain-containing protein n=1 Tax=Leptolyngbya sp. FACHB-261 TaxID=2692806 RepID=UPI001685A9AF|nr:type I restriction enzyme HsdR N-terminal domain-containing protein [Leptolyngbya sp. FACHB-261]MBD2104457.1 type I restriction endonuclease subunit R [Leptolyngbya sp. FACHB-261]
MTTTRATSKTIPTTAVVEDKFGLTLTADPQFFTEWRENLPNLTDLEKETLNLLQQRFAAHRRRGTVSEGAVDKLLVSPLLDLAGFYELPFEIRTEEPVEFAVAEEDELLRGRIDTLIIQDQLWVVVIEAKRTIMVSLAVPQALSYMMCSPNPERPVYGLVSNGDEFIFLKVKATPKPEYSSSKLYSLFFPPNSQDLYEVFQVLKRIGTVAI